MSQAFLLAGAYRTTPIDTAVMPPGVSFIVFNEAAERFSYYGMRSILVAFMSHYMVDASGAPDHMGEAEARQYYHYFVTAVYFFPLVGAVVADSLLGKYRTILGFSLVYCGGHLALALNGARGGLLLGLALISVGSGGIKPCVSANVGDQFGARNAHLLPKVFGWFYFSINLGAFASSLSTPALLQSHGPHAAFGVPGVLMALATLAFWLGRHRFAHVPADRRRFVSQSCSAEGGRVVGRLLIIYTFIAMFWALYDQTGSAWVQQATHMDRNFLGVQWLPSQVQAVNSLLVLVYIPLFNGFATPQLGRLRPRQFVGFYGMAARGCATGPLRRIGLGLGLTVLPFLLSALVFLPGIYI